VQRFSSGDCAPGVVQRCKEGAGADAERWVRGDAEQGAGGVLEQMC
jgi:hypothetical protein